MDCSLLGFSVHGISQAIILECVVQKVPFILQGIFVTQRSDPHLLHWQAESLPIVVYICQSQSPNSLYSHPFSLWYHLLVLYIWLSISALQTGSSVPFSRFHRHALIYIFLPLSDLLHSVWLPLGPSVHVCMLSHFSLAQHFVTLWTVPHQAPPSVGFPGKNTWMGYNDLLQGIFPTQGFSQCVLCFLYWQVGSLPLVPPVKPLDPSMFQQKAQFFFFIAE